MTDADAIANLGQRLVDGVVDHLVDEVMQRAHIGSADVHAGAPAHGLQPLQDLDGRCVVLEIGVSRFPSHRVRSLSQH